MHITLKERTPGTWRLRIETGRTEKGVRLFKYETLHGTEDQAKQRRWELLTAHEEGTFTAPEKLTLSAYFKIWKKSRQALKKISRSTADTYEVWFNVYIAPTLGGLRVQKVTGIAIQTLYTDLLTNTEGRKEPLSLNTVACVHRLMTKLFKDVRKSKIVKVNPMEEVEAPGKKKSAPKAIKEADVLPLMTSLAGDWKEPIAYLGFGAGMRRGELCGFRWKYAELDAARLVIAGQLLEYRDGTIEWVEHPKTDAGVRTIAIDDGLVTMLRRLKFEAMENRMKLGLGGGIDDAYVFTSDGVAPIKPGALTQSFSDHCDKHGLPGFTLHGTRHTHLTELLRKVGKSGARMVQERAGHSDITTTLRTYQTVFESDDRELAGLSSGLTKGAK